MSPKLRIPSNILKELASLFILNVAHRLNRFDIVKFCCHIEKSHWHYLDVICVSDNNQIKCTLNEFTSEVFPYVPLLSRYSNGVNRILDEFKL